MVQEILQLLFKSFSLTAERLLLDHLPGGKYNSISDAAIIKETASVPTTNVAPERDFAVLDRLMSQKPNATTIALESLLLYSQNKTSDWLNSKTEVEKERFLQASRTLTSAHRANFLKRREEIVNRRKEAQARKELQVIKKREKEIKEKEQLTKMIECIGLWTIESEIESGLEVLKSVKEKVAALKLQINFRKKVIGQTHSDKNVFQFSHNRKQFSCDELVQNLKKLLSSQNSLVLSTEEIFSDPDLLIYRRIEHQFNCEGNLVWYKGTVLDYNKDSKEFRIKYDDEDEEYSYPLLEDFANNEVRIIYQS